MRPTRRLLPALLPVAFLLGSCGDSYQVAARVGDTEFTHAEIAEKAEAFAGSEQFMSQLQLPPAEGEGRVPQQVVSEVLNLDIQAELVRMAAGEQASGAALDDVRSQVEEQLGPWFASFPDDLREEAIDDVAVLQLSNQVAPSDADVYVSPRYGEVDATGIIGVPEGARPGPAGSDAPPGPGAPPGP